MRLKLRIILFQLILGLAVIVMGSIAVATITTTTNKLQRARHARLQLDAAMQLAVHANRYSEQIAELLLIGSPERPDFEGAREQVIESLRQCSDVTRLEIASLRDAAEREEESLELDRLRSMRSLFREIDLAVERLLLLSQEGRQTEAVALFRSEIENRLDADFERLIAALVSDERSEVARVDDEITRSARRMALGTIAALALILGVTAASGLHFYRTIEPPLRALTEGTVAIERGDLGHRVPHDKEDELGRLARRFNQMAEELERQRGVLLEGRAALQREVAERTKELAEANRRLQELDRQRVLLLADVSHELRTPLTALRGEAEVALRGISKPESVYRDALELIVNLAADMARLVDDLLFLARSEADELRFEFKPVHLADLVREAVDDASAFARGKSIRLSLQGPPTDLTVRADARRLKQVVLIVLDNAIKYSPRSSNIDIALVGRNGSVELIVADQGEGVLPEDLPHVFDRFFRGENARALGVGGSGLGLPIACWIVEKHGGELTLASEPTGGTKVTLRLPAEVGR
jgi:two-component system, OmpR family, sensor kinase